MSSQVRRLPLMLIVSVVVLCAGLVAAPLALDVAAATGTIALTPDQIVHAAWRNMQKSGEYRFSTQLEQITWLAPKLVNVGRSSKREMLDISGQANLPASTLVLALNDRATGGNSLAQAAPDTVEIKITGSSAQGRVGGGDWEPIENFSGSFAPGNDPVAYLVGAANIQVAAADPVWPASVKRYTFNLDTDAFSRYVGDQLQQQLRSSGELPPSVQLDTASLYRSAQGNGEVLISADGLPARLQVHMAFPQDASGQRVEFNVTTSFSDFNRANLLATAAPPTLGAALVDAWRNFSVEHSLPRTAGDLGRNGLQFMIIAGLMGLTLFALLRPKSKRVRAIMAGVLVFSMIVPPALENGQVYAYNETQRTKAAAAQQDQAAREAVQTAVDQVLNPEWNPQQDPLQVALADYQALLADLQSLTLTPNIQHPTSNLQPLAAATSSTTGDCLEDKADIDNDGLNGLQECLMGTDVKLPDTDGDGLTDKEELLLGTNPLDADTDGDLLTDKTETSGSPAGGKTWYTDPNNPDTNGDGLTDGFECPQRVAAAINNNDALNPTGPNIATACQDTNGNGTPDFFDEDNDGDKVVDAIDISPNDKAAGYSQSNPFKFTLNGLTKQNGNQSYPLLMDLQVRPVTDTHLGYSSVVWNWPTGDDKGNVQETFDKTFADFMDAGDQGLNPSAANGDLRVTPMLEVRMGGANLPVPMVNAEASYDLAENGITGTIRLTQSGANVNVNVAMQSAGTYTLTISDRACAAVPPSGGLSQSGVSGTTNFSITNRYLTDLADSSHTIYLRSSAAPNLSACQTMVDLPNGGQNGKMVDPNFYPPHGIAARDISTSTTNAALLIYVPLNLTDDKGGSHMAFTAHIPFRPDNAAAWGNASEARLVWLVQMLDGSGGVNVIHSYSDDWTLTGLTVSEDRGLKVGVVYENPTTDNDKNSNDRLWALANSLERTFNAGRSDMTIDEVNRRFNPALNSGVTLTQTWGLSKTAFSVYTATYPTADDLARVPMTVTPQLLANFTNQNVKAPVLLYLQESTSRNMALGDTRAVPDANGVFNIDFSGATTSTVAGLNWSPYQYRNGQWQDFPITQYWDQMKIDLQDNFVQEADAGGDEDAETLLQSYFASLQKGVYRTLAGKTPNFNNPPALDKALLDEWQAGGLDRAGYFGAIAETMTSMLVERNETAAKYAKALVGDINPKSAQFKQLRNFANKVDGRLTQFESRFSQKWKHFGTGLTAAQYAGALAVGIASQFDNPKAKKAVAGLTLSMAVIDAISSVKDAYDQLDAIRDFSTSAIKGAGGTGSNALKEGLKGLVKSQRAAKAGAAVGFVVTATVATAMFITQMALTHVKFGSLAFNAALADLVAELIVAGIMLALSLAVPVGSIIAAVVGAIDGLIASACAIVDVAKDPNQAKKKWSETNPVGKRLCQGLSGLLGAVVKLGIYNQRGLIGNMASVTRLQTYNLDAKLVDTDRELGYTPGAKMQVSVGITNTILRSAYLKNDNTDSCAGFKTNAKGEVITNTVTGQPVCLSEWEYAKQNDFIPLPFDPLSVLYAWQYSDANARKANFDYKVQSTEKNIHSGLNLGPSDWDRWQRVAPRKFTMTTTVQGILSLPGTGLNQPLEAILSEGYAVPVQECFIVPIPILPGAAPVCTIRADRDTKHLPLGEGLLYDVFPRTLDGFFAAAARDGGYAPAWTQSGELTFERQLDFDGDGLMNLIDAGSDPDDSRWDTDGDGLPDGVEVSVGSDPQNADTDNDGLNDATEVRLGTSPTMADTDGDGLRDNEERDGWTIAAGSVMTRIYSDPLEPDADADGLTDALEKVYGFNPNSPNKATVLTFESQLTEKNTPALLWRFEETAGAQTFSDWSGHGQTAACAANACPTAGVVGKVTNGVDFNGSTSVLTTTLPDSFAGNSSFTVAFWMKYQPTGSRAWVMDFGNRTTLQAAHWLIDSAGNAEFGFWADAQNRFSLSAYQGQWVHIATVYDSAAKKLTTYLNATQSYSSSVQSTPNIQVSGGLRLGQPIPNDSYYKGQLDEVALFPGALSQAQVQAVMDARYNINDQIVLPQTGAPELTYDATIKNELNARVAQGLFRTELPSAISTSSAALAPFVLQPEQGKSLSGTLNLVDNIASGAYSVTQAAYATVADWTAQSGGASLWLDFNEAAAPFYDTSGSYPQRNGTCTNCPTTGQPGMRGKAVSFDGTRNAVTVQNAPNLANQSFSVSFWAKLADATASSDQWVVSGGEVSNNKNLHIGFTSSGKFFCGFWNDDAEQSWTRDTNWHQWACAYNADSKEQKLYRDGTLIFTRAANANFQGTGPLFIGSFMGSVSFFKGQLDDLRIFPRALTQQEAGELFNRPLVLYRFDESGPNTASVDSSGNGNDGVCPPDPGKYTCPARSLGVTNQAGLFSYIPSSPGVNPADYFSTKNPVDLTGGKFTIALWLYPDSRIGDGQSGSPQGILGVVDVLPDDTATALVGLERVGRKLRFGVGTGDRAKWFTTTNDVLTLDAWQHVVLTYDQDQKNVKVYIDGVNKANANASFPLSTPSAASRFNIGRANNYASLDLTDLKVEQAEDCAPICNSDLEIKVFKTPWKWADGGTGQWVKTYGSAGVGNHPNYFNDDPTGYYEWMENYFEEYDKGAQNDVLGAWVSYVFDPGQTYDLYYSTGTEFEVAEASRQFTTSSIPFFGLLDDVAIYNRILTSAEADTLYQSGKSRLYLPLDDLPGSTTFRNRLSASPLSQGTVGINSATCSGSGCPLAGVDGRNSYAAQFDGNDVLNWSGDVNEYDHAVSLWFKTQSSNGILFAVNDSSTNRRVYLESGKVCAKTGTATSVTTTLCTPAGYADGNWHFVLHTVSRPDINTNVLNQTLSIDGGTPLTGSAVAAAPQSNDTVSVGSGFTGLLDEVRVYGQAISLQPNQTAPNILLHLNESLGSTTFANVGSGGNPTCVGSCPQAGVKGQVSLAAQFTQTAALQTNSAPNLNNTSFTFAFWARRNQTTEGYPLVYGANNDLLLGFNASNQFVCGPLAGQAAYTDFLWNHWACAYDAATKRLALYRNGSEITSTVVSALNVGSTPRLTIGNFPGALDEVSVYGDRVLSEFDIREAYQTQLAVVEERQVFAITVDSVPPTSTLRSTARYRPLNDAVLDVGAVDQHSAVALVELGVKKPGDNAFTFSAAPACLDADKGVAWCPSFVPTAEGRYDVQTRAIDAVGNRETPAATTTFYVDGTGPGITSATIVTDALIVPNENRLTFPYTFSDPALPGGMAGSGVMVTHTARLLLTDLSGVEVAGRLSFADLGSNNWNLYYDLPGAITPGTYTVTVSVADAVGNQRVYARRIRIDSAQPAATIDAASLAPGNTVVISSTGVLQGSIDVYQTPPGSLVWLPFEESAGATTLRQNFALAHPASQSSTAAGQPASLAVDGSTGGTAASTNNEFTPWWQVDLADAQLITNVVIYASSTLSNVNLFLSDRPFTSTNPTDVQNAASVWRVAKASLGTGGVAITGAEFTRPGATITTTLLARYLRVQLGVTGTLALNEVQVNNLGGTCSTCPTLGLSGVRGNAASFNGNTQTVSVSGLPASLAGDKSFSVAFWMNYQTTANRAWIMDIGNRTTLQAAHWLIGTDGNAQFGFWAGAQNNFSLSAYQNQWVHVATVYDTANKQLTTYLNGVLADSDSVTSSPDLRPANGLRIGSPGSSGESAYQGSLDEVLLYDRVLTANEIALLARYRVSGVKGVDVALTPQGGSAFFNYPATGSDPLLFLNFEGNTVIDSSVPPHDVLPGNSLSPSDPVLALTFEGDRLIDSAGGTPIADYQTWTFIPGQVGRGLHLDARGDSSVSSLNGLSASPLSLNSNGYTAAAWFRTSSSSGEPYLLYAGKTLNSYEYDKVFAYLDANGNVCAATSRYRSGSAPENTKICSTGVNYADNQWHHLVHTLGYALGTTNHRLYMDGALKNSAAVISTVAAYSGAKFGAGLNDLSSNPFTGMHTAYTGDLDEIQIFTRTLTAAEITNLATVREPVRELAFTRGMVGDSALRLSPGVQLRALGGVNETNYTAAFWFRTSQRNNSTMYRVTAYADSAYDRAIYLDANGNVCAYVSNNETICSSGVNYADNQWHHVAHTLAAPGQKLYVDGTLKQSGVKSASDFTSDTMLRLGGDFAGDLDDVQVYPRALSGEEINVITFKGWRPATVTQSGANVGFSTWAYTLPAGLEGYYTIDLRAVNQADQGHYLPAQWQGALDTLAPRVTLSASNGGGRNFTAHDFNLDESSLNCPGGKTSTRTNYQSQWYTALQAGDRLFGLTISSCESGGNTTLDTSFGTAGIVRKNPGGFTAGGAALQSDGKLVSVGSKYVLRHNKDGSLDTTFGNNGQVTDSSFRLAKAVAIQSDGKIVVAGYDEDVQSNFMVVRHTITGTLDTTFDGDGVVVTDLGGWDYGYAIAIQSDGKILVAGSNQGCSSCSTQFTLVRYNTNGSLDTTFDGDGIVRGNWNNGYTGRSISVQSDGKIIVALDGNSNNFELARYTITGTLDTTFDGDGRVTTDFAGNSDYSKAVAIQSDGKIVVAGYSCLMGNFCNWNFALARYTITGTLDTTFDGDGKVTTDFGSDMDYVNAVATQSNGKIVVAGESNGDFALARYNSNGSLEATFGNNGLMTTDFGGSDSAQSVLIQTDGNIVVAGSDRVNLILVRYLSSPSSAPVTYRICDFARNCVTPTPPTLTSRPNAVTNADTLYASILYPAGNAVLQSTDPVTVAGFATADPDYLQAITLTVNGAEVGAQVFATDTVTNTVFEIPWTPAGEGAYSLEATALDSTGALTALAPTTVYVDTHLPQSDFGATTITMTAYSNGFINFSGPLTETSPARLQLQIGEAVLDAQANGDLWNTAWPVDISALPDGLTFPLALTVTDVANNTITRTATAQVDVLSPAPVTLAVTAGGVPVPIGDTLPVVSATLTFTWTPSSDGNGLSGYVSGWDVSSGDTVNATRQTFAPTATLASVITLSEGQKATAVLNTTDVPGNLTAQTVGPFYAESPLTPDYVSITPDPNTGAIYRGWANLGCSLLGTDDRIFAHADPHSTLANVQNLYTTWNVDSLRLLWTGANWDTDGDLFIYLDTQLGGTDRAYDPYLTRETIVLLPATGGLPIQGNTPADQASQPLAPLAQRWQTQHQITRPLAAAATNVRPFRADYVLWIKSQTEAIVLKWTDATQTWEAVTNPIGYGYHVEEGAQYTDLQVPFATIGLTDPALTPFSLLAFASEDNGLRIWATAPRNNPANSPRLTEFTRPQSGRPFVLLNTYSWAKAGAGQCPNGTLSSGAAPAAISAPNASASQYTDAIVDINLSAEPAALTYSVLGDGLYDIMSQLSQFSGNADFTSAQTELCAVDPTTPGCVRDNPPSAGTQAAQANYPLKSQVEPIMPGKAARPMLMPNAPTTQPEFNAEDNLSAEFDTSFPPVGDGDGVTYTFRLKNQGTTTLAHITLDALTYGPLRLPDGVPDSDAYGEYYSLVQDIGELAPGAETTVNVVGQIDYTFDAGNVNAGLADLDVVLYDSRGTAFANQLDWLYASYQLDLFGPLTVLEPASLLIQPGLNTITGRVYDESPVPDVMLEVSDPIGNVTDVTCDRPDTAVPTWSCEWDAGEADDGDQYSVRARATDVYGQTSDWTSWVDLTVDEVAPKVVLDTATSAALGDALIGPAETTFTGRVTDNRSGRALDVCDVTATGETCQRLAGTADDLPQTTFVYADIPATPLPLGAGQACYSGNEIYRFIHVPDSFTIADIKVGLNIEHPYRYDATAWLQAPSGSWLALLWNAEPQTQNVDALLSDSAVIDFTTDRSDHDVSEPLFDRTLRPENPLGFFRGEQAQGDWLLMLCDYFPSEDDGTYQQAQLILTAATLPENVAARWNYQYSTPGSVDHAGPYTLRFYGVDSIGNRSTTPLETTFYVDTVDPVITVTQASATLVYTSGESVVLTGSVTDGSAITALFADVQSPSGALYNVPIVLNGSDWTFATQLLEIGEYSVHINALDAAGNASQSDEYIANVMLPKTYLFYLPVILRDYAAALNLSLPGVSTEPAEPIVTPVATATLEPTPVPTESAPADGEIVPDPVSSPTPEFTPAPTETPPLIEPPEGGAPLTSGRLPDRWVGELAVPFSA